MTIDDDLVAETVNHSAIQRLQSAYADVINRRAFGELVELFLPDCTVVVDTLRGEPIRAVGPDAFASFVGPAVERFDFFEFVILSSRIEVGAGDDASARLYMQEVRHDRELGARSEAFGIYLDDYRRVDGRWWFASRRYQSLARTAADPTAGRDLDVFAFPELDG